MQDLTHKSETACRMLKELGHPVRLSIVCTLCEGECCVNDLMDRLGLRQANLSQHLGRLRAAKLVKGRRNANRVYYSVASDEADSLIRALHGVYCGPMPEASQAA